MLDHISIT